MTFKILGIDHLGLAPKDPQGTNSFFEQILQLQKIGEELVAEQKVNTIMFESASAKSESLPRLEVLDTMGDTEGPVAKFLSKKGSGIHHVALRVDNILNALAYLKSKNVQLIDEVPRDGSHQTKIAFIHPRATGGLLIELVEQVL